MPKNFPVEKSTFIGAGDEETYRSLSYDMFKSIHDSQVTVAEKHDKRISCLEKRKIKDTTIAAGSGLTGGFLAVLLRKWFMGA